ncbi:hypothetical protein M9X92_006497 [Pyricularia oryzae]|nr:hypothetical protein M9X92_006497 [Pyricularia oryzae]
MQKCKATHAKKKKKKKKKKKTLPPYVASLTAYSPSCAQEHNDGRDTKTRASTFPTWTKTAKLASGGDKIAAVSEDKPHGELSIKLKPNF